MSERPLSTNSGHPSRVRRTSLLQVGAFCECERVLDVNVKLAHGVQFGMTKQDLDSPYIAGPAIDQRDLGPTGRVCSVD